MAEHRFALVIDGEVYSVYRRPNSDSPASWAPLLKDKMFPCGSDVEPGWTMNGAAFSPPVRKQRRVISSLEFFNRVSKEKRIAIRNYAKTSGPYASDIADFLDMMFASQEVELDGPNVLQALGLLKALKLLDDADIARVMA
jgi:hypothetical protein